MNRALCTALWFLLAIAGVLFAQTSSPMLPPETGYGSPGPYHTVVDSVPHAGWGSAQVYLFSPREAEKPVPLILFCHGLAADRPSTYRALIDILVSKGYAVLYSPYQTFTAYHKPTAAYEQLWKGIRTGMSAWAARLDTTRVGVVGHSYGGGAVPWVAWNSWKNQNWGTQALFMVIMAPWYSYNLTQPILRGFPPYLTFLVEIFDNDNVNDPRMARDLFENIQVPSNRKSFCIIHSDWQGADTLWADHGVPTGELEFGPNVNLLDYYGVDRKIDALADFALTGSSQGKAVALGTDSLACFMGRWPNGTPFKPMYAGNRPPMPHPQTWYNNFWNHEINPRAKVPNVRRNSDWSTIDNAVTIRNYFRFFGSRKMLVQEREGTDITTVDTTGGLDEACRVAQPDTGWGANGPWHGTELYFPHPGLGDANIHVITPDSCPPPWPVVFMAPALWKPGTMFYRGLIDHLVSRGSIVVFSTYNYNRFFDQKVRYGVLYDGFNAGVELFIDKVDTTRIAFVGHSYGAGAVPAIARQFLSQRRWGANGSCLFIAAPYFVYNISQQELKDWPFPTTMIVQVYGGDRRMDYRIAEDIFYSIGIHPRNKDFEIITDAVRTGCEIDADHDAMQSENPDENNVVDFYGVYRQLDALMASAFAGDSIARQIALGHGSADQTYCGTWPDGTPVKPFITVSDRPATKVKSRDFVFGWKDHANRRRAFYSQDQ